MSNLTTAPTALRPPAHGVVAWGLHQLSLFLLGLVQILPLPIVLPSTVGVLRAIARREFHWVAFALCLVILAAGVFGIGAFVFLVPYDLRPYDHLILWGGIMLAAMGAGFVTGLAGRRIGVWEIYQALLIVVGAVFALLLQPPVDTFDALGIITGPGTLGHHLLGSVWPALVGIAALAAFTLAVFAASFAFLFFGDRSFDPSFGYERVVGLRYVLAKGLSATAIVTVLGVCVGVATLLTVTAAMSGYQQDIQAKILSTNAHFAIQKYGMDFVEHDKIAAAGLEDDEVVAAAPFVFNLAIAATGDTALGVMVKGVIPERAGQVTDVERNLCEQVVAGVCEPYPTAAERLPQLLAGDQVPALIMGVELLRKLKRKVGDRVILTSPVGIADARGNAPRRMDFRIAGD
ncbi:MAG: ABC transporter permease, partial [Deltaproteobacteria bacterium]|nr:ABC transporter permease [Deltaproteobacteria bacterium]